MFEVIPSTTEVLPLKGADFKIVFKSDGPDQFIKRQLECYVSYTVYKILIISK